MPLFVEDLPVTRGGPFGTPVGYDYTKGKPAVVAPIVFTGQLTRLSALGLSRGVKGLPGARIQEQPDILLAQEVVPRTGDADIQEGVDGLDASGSVSAGAFSNDWFNVSWFNDRWFNSLWFNSTSTITGTANITEDHDDLTGSTGLVFIAGTADIQEAYDTTDTYGSVGNSVQGYVDILEDRDDLVAYGIGIKIAHANIQEDHDTVVAAGPLNIATLRLTWTEVGGMTNVDIYRSTDGVTYTKIGSAPGAAGVYLDVDVSTAFDYYYYLVGTTTISTLTEPSSIEFVDFLQ